MSANGARPRVLYAVAYPNRLNGAQRSLLHLVKRIERFGFEPTVAFTADGICPRAYAEEGIPVRLLALPHSASTYGKRWLRGSLPRRVPGLLWMYPRVAIAVARLLRRERVDIVHCNEPRALFLLGLPARLMRRRVVLHLRGSIAPYPRILRAAISAIPSAIVAVAPSIKRELNDRGAAKCTVVFNPIPVPERTRREPPPEGPWTVLTMASLVPHKGHHHLVEAAAKLGSVIAGRPVRVLILGQTIDDDYEQWLRGRIRELRAEHVELLGWQPDVERHLAAAHVVVSASVDMEQLHFGGRVVEVENAEGTPRQLLEALAAGVPVVATRIPAVEDVIEDGVTGLLVEPRSPGALAEALRQVLEDAKMARELANRGRETVAARHDPATSTRLVAELYTDLLGP